MNAEHAGHGCPEDPTWDPSRHAFLAPAPGVPEYDEWAAAGGVLSDEPAGVSSVVWTYLTGHAYPPRGGFTPSSPARPRPRAMDWRADPPRSGGTADPNGW